MSGGGSSSSGSGGSGGRRSTSSPSPRKTARPPALVPSPLLAPSAAAPMPTPMNLTVRFSTSLPDLHLDIPRPGSTTVVALKHLIRGRLADAHAQRRLRFIHGGRILPDKAVLTAVLRPPPPAPPPTSPDPRGKGKQREGAPAPPPHVYVNCSIGDPLTPAELDDEAEAAAAAAATTVAAPAAVPDTGAGGCGHGHGHRHGQGQGQEHRAGGGNMLRQPPRPRGFDRLLAAGFTAAEVNALRLQFQSIQASRYTPDTMPSPDTLHGMEDAWLDNNNNAGEAALAGPGERDAAAGPDDEFSGLLDVLVRGTLIGFVWPVGSIGWLIMEEGMWSRKWKVFMVLGFILSILVGMIRSLSSDG